MLGDLVRKFSTAGPRYTSYPTAPQFHERVGPEEYRNKLRNLDSAEPLAIYVHVPFCESLCYYCGCNIQITKTHDRARPYVEALIAELGLVQSALGSRRRLRQMSWGGGTPTFLTVSEIDALARAIRESFEFEEGADISIEVDPRVTTKAQLEKLREHGFTRVSLGVQDFDPEVQQAIHRIQPETETVGLLESSRSLGFRGINFDLIYGLPLQTVESFKKTVLSVVRARPDRIALFNYAHLPSLIPHQKLLERFRVPIADERIELFLVAFDILIEAGYRAIGMDHFAVPEDELAVALDRGELYRNFQGYVARKTSQLIGLGASAIGEVDDCYFQNVKRADEYETRIRSGGFATLRGVAASDEDVRRKWIIQSLMCRFRLEKDEYLSNFGEKIEARYSAEWGKLAAFLADGVLEKTEAGYRVTDLGRLFIRNVAMVFDAYLAPQDGIRFSQTV